MTRTTQFHPTSASAEKLCVGAGARFVHGQASAGARRGHFDTKVAKNFSDRREAGPLLSLAANAPQLFFVILVSFVSKCPRRAPALACPGTNLAP